MTVAFTPSKKRLTGWRAYQARLQRQHPRRKGIRLSRNQRIGALAAVLALLIAGSGWWLADESTTPSAPTAKPPVSPAQPAGSMAKADVHILLGDTALVNLTTNPLTVTFDNHPYRVHTSLDFELQRYLLKKLDRINSRYVGIVVMDVQSGRLLGMAGYNKHDPAQDPCLNADFPAASLFKIVAASAAVEKKGYTAASQMQFNGYKHTLYKRQLTRRTNRYTNAISLKNAFAQSVNPVFGKIGALDLDQQTLESYGSAFGFNQVVAFELPWPVSRLAIGPDDYDRAEIASGFNRQTTLSPLHAAVMVSAVVNDGRPMEPTLIERIVDDGDKTIYRSRPQAMPAAVSVQTARVLKQLMHTTVVSGTARKTFRGHRRHKVLSRLDLGGKTGSIFNRAHDARFDWYAGYAAEKKGGEKIAVAVVVAHEEYIGIRAGSYARMAIEHHFKRVFARQADTAAPTG